MAVDEPLTGGRLTAGVVRVGDTVRRPRGPHSEFVAALLRLLEERGFDGAPRHLGTDGGGRDVLTYLDGDVPARFRPWTDEQVNAAAALLRRFHDATRGSHLTGGHAVACHHDPGPNNAVFRAGRPIAFIDFDFAAPGDPLEDVGYLAWTWCVSSKRSAPSPDEQAGQVRVLADGYGLSRLQRTGLVDAMLERQAHNARWWAPRSEPTAPEVAAWSWREHAHTLAHRKVFTAGLDGGAAGRR